MQRTEVDGVPVFWQQGPEPLSAGLCFGVGRRDESFTNGGLTHLVEHLVMGALPKSHLDRNASVSPKLTEFTATGRPDAVAGFLAQVCRLLADLPTERLATEARILAAEEERNGADVLGLLLHLRYGATGLGLLGMTQPGLAALTAEDVRTHVETWFVRENAALWLTGPPPEGLELALRSGSAPRRTVQRRVPLPLPAQTRYPGPDPALTFEASVSGTTLCALRILQDRMTERLRHTGGHSYDVDHLPIAVDESTSHVAFFADAPEKELGEVLLGMWEELHRLAQDGPTAEELADDLEGSREYVRDLRAAEGAVSAAVARRFDGAPYQDDAAILAELERLTPEDVAEALRAALPSLIVLVPEAAPPVLPDVPELPDGTQDPLPGRVHKRRLRAGPPRGARLVASPEGVMLEIGAGQLTVRYDDCVAVGVTDVGHRHLELVGAHGLTLSLCEQDWKDGTQLVGEAEQATRGVPRYRVQEDPDRR